MTMRLRDELVRTARRMSELGLSPGMTGNVSVRSPGGVLVTPSGMPYGELTGDDAVEVKPDGAIAPGQRTPTSEWQLHRDLLAARPDVHAIVHTHSLFCTSISCLRRPIPAIHYMVVRAGGDEIPCADYATFGSAQLAVNVVAALAGGDACLMANHGLVAAGATLDKAMKVVQEVESLCEVYLKALAVGEPAVLSAEEMTQVLARFKPYGKTAPVPLPLRG